MSKTIRDAQIVIRISRPPRSALEAPAAAERRTLADKIQLEQVDRCVAQFKSAIERITRRRLAF
jgi:hypothetical protein